jgi:hypothetical protein
LARFIFAERGIEAIYEIASHEIIVQSAESDQLIEHHRLMDA